MAKSNHIYRPGSRNPNYRNDGKISENRLAWIRTNIGQAVILYYEDHEEEPEEEDNTEDSTEVKTEKIEYGPTVRLMLPQPRGRALLSDITSLTMDELTMLREFYNLLFDLAEPSVIERDRIAKDAYSEGDDSYARSYRPVGQFIVRKGTLRANSESVQRRLESLLDGTGDRRGFRRGVRGDGTELAPGESQEDGTQNDGTTPDKPESIREVGGMGTDPDGVQRTSTGEGNATPST